MLYIGDTHARNSCGCREKGSPVLRPLQRFLLTENAKTKQNKRKDNKAEWLQQVSEAISAVSKSALRTQTKPYGDLQSHSTRLKAPIPTPDGDMNAQGNAPPKKLHSGVKQVP